MLPLSKGDLKIWTAVFARRDVSIAEGLLYLESVRLCYDSWLNWAKSCVDHDMRSETVQNACQLTSCYCSDSANDCHGYWWHPFLPGGTCE